MKQVTDKHENINAEINDLVDRIWVEGRSFNPLITLIEDIRKSDQYQVKDLLIQIEHTLSNHNTIDSLTVYDEQLDHLAHRVSMDDPSCDPPIEEEIERLCYEEMMMEQSKRNRRLWEESELGKQYALARNKVLMENNCSELGFDEISRLISEKSEEFGLELKCHKKNEFNK